VPAGLAAGPVAAGADAAGVVADEELVGEEFPVGAGWADGASSGADSTAFRGAGAGGAFTAGIDALATGVPGEPPPLGGLTPGGGGGGAVPTPNSDGEAVGEDGSANGTDCAACCAFARSATSESVSFFNASASGTSGFGGTVAILGYGWSAPGGGGRCSAIFPPSCRCHQLTGFIDEIVEQPLNSELTASNMAELRNTACLGFFARLACAPLSLTTICWFRPPLRAACVAAGVADAKDVSMATNDKNAGNLAATPPGTATAALEAAGFKMPDPSVVGRSMADIAERSQRLVGEWLKRQSQEQVTADPLNIGRAFMEMTARLMANPARLMQAQLGFWQDYVTLWQNTTRRIMGIDTDPVIGPASNDKRFKDDAWKENEVFDFIKQSYLLSARFVQNVVTQVDGLDDKTAQKVDFYSRQFIDAMSPSNFLMTNPEVLRKTAETGGENLLKGLNNLLADLERGKGQLRIKMTDTDAFKLGENIGISPGKVVFQNELMQLIQYTPSTEKVLKRPLLIVMPWINKFYILDMRPRNSFIRWAVAQGHTVFVTSWVNPDEKLAQKNFVDYMTEGSLTALDAIEAATGERDVNAIGYCLGGTLLACTLAYMAAKGDDRIKTATFFVTMMDFQEAGELGVFIDEEQIQALEAKMSKHGYLEGSEMATTFNLLRANDLIWSFVVNNYLMGNDPFPFDLLYWNSDSTRMPATMHSFYLRKMYQENLLPKPNGITLADVPINLEAIKTPAYFLSTREDHIAPWKSTYRGTQLLGGPKRFVLAASGHIAGVVNPPDGGKYGHWINTDLPPDPESWFRGATEMAGSWWPDWNRWILASDKTQVPARQPGEGKLKPLEDAPGSYVKVRLS
jgi:polyhydroxyalkanoate synthase subunit PhaC